MTNLCHAVMFLGLAGVLLSGCGDREAPRKNESESIAVQGFYRFVEPMLPASPTGAAMGYIGSEFREVLSEASSDGEHAPVSTLTSPLIRVPEASRLDFAVGLAETDSESRASIRFSVSIVENEALTQIFTHTLDTTSYVDAATARWLDFSVDLSAWIGRTVQFVFEAGSGPAQALWADPMIVTTQAYAGERPNLILISLDTLRADHLGAYGYERNTSPNLDRIFQDGFLFEECISPSSWTTPTHASLFTGMSPLLHGAGAFRGARLREEYTTLAELTRDRGHLTAAFTEGAAVGGQLGFHQGFSRYSNGEARQPAPPGEAGRTFVRATQWLNEYGHMPFTLFVHTYEIHWPYIPPDSFPNRFVPDSLNAAEFIAEHVNDPIVLTNDPVHREALVDLYDSGIAYTDSVVGAFFDDLERMGLLENSIVVIFSDHGEAFWEHGQAMHATSLYREVLHVPLFIRFPGQHGTGRVAHKVALEDVFPTIADLMDLDFSAPGRARSLLPLMSADSTGAYDRERVVAQLVQEALGWFFLSVETPQGKYIVTTHTKDNPHSPLRDVVFGDPEYRALSGEQTLLQFLIDGGRDWWTVEGDPRQAMLSSAREELFLYPEDVQEQNDVALEDLETLAAIRAEFMDELSQMQAFVDDVAVKGNAKPLTPEEIEELRALGYIIE